ncbi:ribonuclease HII [Sporolituus thermophilus]|uniref:ribonuclease HII n=1 Tax=Sporolituus thermophilus TaxID=608505 RepID=UPI0014957F07|nr:ribonuclease HII [Sporolituus thermophilus]
MEENVLASSHMTISQIARILEKDNVSPDLLAALQSDERIAVARLLAKWRKRQEERAREYERVQSLYLYESVFYEQGVDLIAGVDEAGRGPLAGPVVVAAVILPKRHHLPMLNDSKKLSPQQRNLLYEKIIGTAVAVTHIIIPVGQIDSVNIYQATLQGMYRALENLRPKPQAALVDAMPLRQAVLPHKSIINGDALSASIAAASVVAKVVRDRYMDEMDVLYPGYGFAKHKGYATPEHLAALRRLGPCPIHRRSFEPIKSWGGLG